MIWAIKPVYSREKMLYEVQCEHPDGNVGAYAQAGFYCTDNLASTLGIITAGKCIWFDKLNERQQEAVVDWLKNNI